MKTHPQPIPTARLLLAGLLCLLPALTRAETAVQAWAQRYNGPGNSDDRANAIAVDGSNNVIVTGSSIGGGGNSDYATIQYSSAGVPLRTNRYNGTGNWIDMANAVAVDASNNVIVTGYSASTSVYPYNLDYATIQYSSAGVPLWTNIYSGGPGEDQARAVAVDGSNNVVVTGSSGSVSDYATIKYSEAGVPLWTNRYNGLGVSSVDEAYALAVDGSNNVFVTGSSGSAWATIQYSSAGVPMWTNRNSGVYPTSLAVDRSNNVIVTGIGIGNDYLTIKYSGAGVLLWTNRHNGPGNGSDGAYAVAMDSSNNVIVTGYSTGSGSGYDYATIKYSSAGVPLWTNRYNGPGNGSDSAVAVAVDGSNNVFVTGSSTGSGSANDFATIEYSSEGLPLWTNRYNGPGNGYDQVHALAVDRNGSVIVTGESPGSGGNLDFATIKYICVASPVMTGLNRTDGTFQMRVDEVLQPGTLVIEASTNLTGWEAIFTNTTPTNVLFYTDPEASSYLWRFYRAFQFP